MNKALRLSSIVLSIMRLMQSIPAVGSAAAELLRLRLQLFAEELQFERVRFIQCLVLCIFGATMLGVGVLAFTAVVIFSAAEENRFFALCVATGIHLSLGVICIGIGLHNSCNGRDPFKSSTDAFKADGKEIASMFKK
ncbi:MAG: phage holin family protein [Opitutales bacterium]|nr:phage holin family protein [Opitutales bacterium]